MDQSERRNRIVEYLRIKPISHGQVYTFQIALPTYELKEVFSQRREEIERSLTEQGTNLIPLIVRRTEAYSEEEEYEVVYGADWCLVAKELDIEKLWVWVFDMTDEQAATAKAEMEQLTGSPMLGDDFELESLLDQKLKPITAKLTQLFSLFPGESRKSTADEKLAGIERQIEHLVSTIERLAAQVEQLLPPPKLNLLQAEDEAINRAMEESGATIAQRQAALKAIKYWKTSDKGLTWQNLEESTKNGEYKIKGFAKGTYQKLKNIADIRILKW